MGSEVGNELAMAVIGLVLWWEIYLFVKHLQVSGWKDIKRSWLITFPIKY